ncbi:MAG: 23S rRNA (pseudouridine(1915)-N(3))-methyltransferase RlmH [Planctomycetota bacterium]|nr:23S rRNA (pseudouridine(1915)-N(3))-methyltransferase RlmH [Planctomycetota bacterium]
MKIALLCVGKLRSEALRAVCDDYAARLRRYGAFEVLELKPAQAREPAAAVAEESKRILEALEPAAHVWVLDERGKTCTSPALAERISALEQRSTKRLAVILGGAYGLGEDVKRKGERLSLSPMTFNHELCRAVILEQLYRARTIQRGEPYHH